MDASYLEFLLPEPARFERLVSVFNKLRQAKEQNVWPEPSTWLDLFDDASKKTFWWPTPDEVRDWERQWFSTPVERRWSDPSLVRPWTFESMIEAFENGEYNLLACRRVDDSCGRLEFIPLADPLGGTECMRALIEAFGGRVTGEAGT